MSQTLPNEVKTGEDTINNAIILNTLTLHVMALAAVARPSDKE